MIFIVKSKSYGIFAKLAINSINTICLLNVRIDIVALDRSIDDGLQALIMDSTDGASTPAGHFVEITLFHEADSALNFFCFWDSRIFLDNIPF